MFQEHKHECKMIFYNVNVFFYLVVGLCRLYLSQEKKDLVEEMNRVDTSTERDITSM